jgi:hypothetical protein
LRSASTLGRLPKTAPRISGDFSLPSFFFQKKKDRSGA